MICGLDFDFCLDHISIEMCTQSTCLGDMCDAPSSTAKSTAPIGAPKAALTPAAAPAATKSRYSASALQLVKLVKLIKNDT